MTRGIPSIRRDLFLRLLATALLPLLVVGALSVALLMDYLKGDALDDGDHIALNMAAQLRGRLAAAESAAHTLAGVLRSLEPGSGNAATTERIMCETVRSQSLFEAIYLVGPECRVLSIGLPESQRARTEDFIGIDLSRLPLLQQTLKEKVPLWSDSQLSLITGQPGLSYCIPHKDGLLVVACTLPAMENLPKVHGGSRVYSTLLLDAKGVVLIETNGRRPGKIIKLDHEPLIAASLAGKADKGAFQWGGLECLGSTVIIPQTGWVVISFASRTEALRTLNLMLGLSVLGIVLGALFAGLLALAMARRIVKPLAVLSDMTTEIAGGKYGATIDSQPYRELEQVAASLRSMGATIQERERRQQDTEAELRQAQKMEAVGRLVGGIAHDFNNMLQGIRGFTELARSDLPEEHPVQEHLSEVNNASSRAAELVQQLLIFSRKDNPKPCHIDLNEFLAQSLKMLRRVIGEQLLIDFTPSAQPAWIVADAATVTVRPHLPREAAVVW